MSKKWIWVSVGLLLTIVLCGVLIAIANKGKASIDNTSGQYDKMVSQYDDVRFSTYDNATASGSEIVNLIKGLTSTDGVTISVKNGSGTTTEYTYSSLTAAASTQLTDIVTKTKTNMYINSFAQFSSTLTRDANGVITKISFVQTK